jgi:small subunit ribosomal protein S16
MLAIRLRRIGKKSQPSYRLIVSEKAKATNSSVLEFLGNYAPSNKEKTASLNKERILHWISKGAQPSASVHNLLLREGIIKGDKVKSFHIPTKVKLKKAENKKKEEEKAKKVEEPVAPVAPVAENKDLENKEEASV